MVQYKVIGPLVVVSPVMATAIKMRSHGIQVDLV